MALIADPAVIERHLSFVAGLLPEAVVRLLSSDLQGFLKFQQQHLGVGLGLSLFFTATCGRTAVASLISALNTVYGAKDSRRAIRKQGVSFFLVLAILAFVAIAFALVALMPLIVYYLVPLGRGWRQAIDYLRWPLMALMMIVSLSRLYQLAPHHERRRRGWFGWGPAVATALWLLFSVAYSLYLGQVGSYNVIYGSVSSTVVLLIWLYLSSLAVLIGAEIDALNREGKAWQTDLPIPPTKKD